MIEKKTVSQCISADYCRGWNDAVDTRKRGTGGGMSMTYHDMCIKLSRLVYKSGYAETSSQAYAIAEYLLDNDVTLKEPQRPMTEREVFERTKMPDAADRIVWMEELGWGDGVCRFICLLVWSEDEECYEYWMIGCDNRFSANPNDYGKKWRCWAEMPTDEEYEATKWEV